jgi:hypothetical protein
MNNSFIASFYFSPRKLQALQSFPLIWLGDTYSALTFWSFLCSLGNNLTYFQYTHSAFSFIEPKLDDDDEFTEAKVALIILKKRAARVDEMLCGFQIENAEGGKAN